MLVPTRLAIQRGLEEKSSRFLTLAPLTSVFCCVGCSNNCAPTRCSWPERPPTETAERGVAAVGRPDSSRCLSRLAGSGNRYYLEKNVFSNLSPPCHAYDSHTYRALRHR